MKDKIIIDTEDSMYPKMLANALNEKISNLGIPTVLVNGSGTLTLEQRTNAINNAITSEDTPLIISLRQNSSSGNLEIIYALRDNASFATFLDKNLTSEGVLVEKYYQLRDEENPIDDADYIIRNTSPNRTTAILLGSLNNDQISNDLESNQKIYVEGITRAITEFLDISYIPEEGNYYVVKKGDSLYSISKEFGVSVDDIKLENNITSNTLQIGDVLKIPEEKMQITNNTYIVQKGDSLYSIANKFNTSVDTLKNINNLTSNTLQIDQKLIIPSSTTIPSTTKYTVQIGDSLYSIASKYDTTVDELKKVNVLTSNTLQIGQILTIPSKTTLTEIKYKVQKGDSLYSIASKYDITVDELKNNNNLTSNTLQIGQILTIPR